MQTIIIIHEEDLAKLGGPTVKDATVKVITDLTSPTEIDYVPGQRYLVIEKKAYDYVTKTQNVHLGPRNEHIGDIVKMPYLVLNNGAILKFTYLKGDRTTQFLSKAAFEGFHSMPPEVFKREYPGGKLSSGIGKNSGRPWFKIDYEKVDLSLNGVSDFLYDPNYVNSFPPQLSYSKIIREKEDIEKSFNYFISLKNYIFGLDYETSGIPVNEPDVKIMGVGIAAETGQAAYFDMEFISRTDYYDYFLAKYKEFLDITEDRIYTYNVGFECRATYLLFKKYYNFHDSATLNILEGNNLKRYSLKYTAMKALGVASWDDDFDYLLEKLPEVFEGNEDVKKEIFNKFGEEDEFKRLMAESNNNPFASIPSSILGKYCMLDSFYTVMLKKKADLQFTDTAWNTFCDNLRLGALLDFDGYLKDTDIWEEYVDKLESISALMGINLAQFYFYKTKGRFDESVSDLNPTIIYLMENQLNPHDSKAILKACQDGGWESGIDESKLEGFGIELINLFREKLAENKIDVVTDSVFRKRKLFEELDVELKKLYPLPREISYYQNHSIASNLRRLIMDCRLTNYNKKMRPTMGEDLTNEQVVEFCSSIVNIASPIESMKFLSTLYYQYEDYLKGLFPECDLDNHVGSGLDIVLASEELEKIGIPKPEEWTSIHHVIMSRGLVKEKEHPWLYRKMEESIEPVLYQLKERKESRLAAYLQGGAFQSLSKDEQREFIQVFDIIDVRDVDRFSLVKLSTAYRMFKKSEKRLKTYLKKILLKEDKQTNGYDENLFTTQTYGGPVTKSYQRYEICCKKSKRWSAAIHTLSPKDEAKRVITTPEGYLMSYFDIN